MTRRTRNFNLLTFCICDYIKDSFMDKIQLNFLFSILNIVPYFLNVIYNLLGPLQPQSSGTLWYGPKEERNTHFIHFFICHIIPYSFKFTLFLFIIQLCWSKLCPTLQFRGLEPARLLCPWDSPGKSTEVGSHPLLQGIFLTQGSNPSLQCGRQILNRLRHQGGPLFIIGFSF